MKIALFDSSGSFQDGFRSQLTNYLFKAYPNSDIIGLKCDNNALSAYRSSEEIKSSDIVIIWNGSEIGCFWVKQICKTFNIPFCVVERGLFPQGQSNFIVDREGICCRSESIQEKYLDKSNLNQLKNTISNHFIENNLEYKNPEDKYVFVFQLEFDSTVYHYSNFDSNENMVDRFINSNKIEPSKVVVCPHPRNKGIKSKYKISKNKTIQECQNAKLAIGISSTTMYEILGMGCPVKVLGGNNKLIHPINRQWSNKNLIIPTILQNQLESSDDGDAIRYKIEKNL